MIKGWINISYLLLGLSILMAVPDDSLHTRLFPTNNLMPAAECSGLMDTATHDDADCFGDDVIATDSRICSNLFAAFFISLPVYSDRLRNAGSGKNWQPPKFSAKFHC